ncbi:MAG: hypothetical protein Ta2E_00040 [Mycoplasmoidaceae bacterium]|nr:MAG: hypothetical protein Ta2E_00040 [Mycoplasmoidaceae bacterium]
MIIVSARRNYQLNKEDEIDERNEYKDNELNHWSLLVFFNFLSKMLAYDLSKTKVDQLVIFWFDRILIWCIRSRHFKLNILNIITRIIWYYFCDGSTLNLFCIIRTNSFSFFYSIRFTTSYWYDIRTTNSFDRSIWST